MLAQCLFISSCIPFLIIVLFQAQVWSRLSLIRFLTCHFEYHCNFRDRSRFFPCIIFAVSLLRLDKSASHCET